MVAFTVVVEFFVSTPFGAITLPTQFCHEFAQFADIHQDQFLVKTRRFQVGTNVLPGSAIARIQFGLQPDMAEHTGTKAVAKPENSRRSLHPNTIDTGAHQRLKVHTLIGLQHQWKQKHFTELAVACPGRSRRQCLERRNVDEHSFSGHELDVVGCRVLERHTFQYGRLDQVQLQQGRIAQHAKGPFIWIGDDRNPLMFDKRGPLQPDFRRQRHLVRIQHFGADELALIHELSVENSGFELPEVFQRRGTDAPDDPTLMPVNSPVPVAE